MGPWAIICQLLSEGEERPFMSPLNSSYQLSKGPSQKVRIRHPPPPAKGDEDQSSLKSFVLARITWKTLKKKSIVWSVHNSNTVVLAHDWTEGTMDRNRPRYMWNFIYIYDKVPSHIKKEEFHISVSDVGLTERPYRKDKVEFLLHPVTVR